MAKNKMTDLRDHLFLVIEKLSDPEEGEKMDVQKAKAINDCAKTIIDSARVEADLLMHF